MTDKGSKLTDMSKRSENTAVRFKAAYERFNQAHRKIAKRVYCELFSITDGSFRNKMSGANSAPVFETEATWMENFNPLEYRNPTQQPV